LSVEFQLVSHPNHSKNILAIDVIQKIDDEVVVETVQRKAGEAYAILGIDGLPKERLEDVLRDILDASYHQIQEPNATLTVTMSPNSTTSGEVRGVVQIQGTNTTTSIPVNYQHYYVLNALRETMSKELKKTWQKVTAIYRNKTLELAFDY